MIFLFEKKLKMTLRISKDLSFLIGRIQNVKWYQVSNPKKVELLFDNTTLKYKILLDGEFLGYYIKDVENKFFPKIFYINNNTFLIRYGMYEHHEGYWEQNNEIWKDGKIIRQIEGRISFVNEIAIIYSLFLCSFFEVSLSNNFHYNLSTDQVNFFNQGIEETGPFHDSSESTNFMILREILEFEMNKIFPNYVSDYSILSTFSSKKDEKNDEMIDIHLSNGEIQKVKMSKIKKYNSELLSNQLENGEIYLPLSHFDNSFECLDYIGAKYLDIKLLKKFLKKLN